MTELAFWKLCLDPVAESIYIVELLKEHGWTQRRLAAELGISQTSVAQRIRFLNTEDEVQASTRDYIWSRAAALETLRLRNPRNVSKLRLREKRSVRAVRRDVAKLGVKPLDPRGNRTRRQSGMRPGARGEVVVYSKTPDRLVIAS